MKLGSLLPSVCALGLLGCQMDYKVHTDPGPNVEGEDTSVPTPDQPNGNGPEETGDTWQPANDEGGPIADCQVSPNPVEPPFEKASWDGSGSYDPEGGTITDHNWQLISQPAGSAVSMPTGGAVRNNFTPDLAGDYIGRLTVTNDSGETDSCEITLESIPAENLWIEMYWDTANDDMDLHLLHSTGTLEDWLWNSDCYYLNCTGNGVEWGNAGPADNPTLDLDDISGTGPENINISQPSDSSYTVIVHDYQGSTPDYQGSNNVTVNIYINGVLEWTDTRGISGENSYTEFARINWTNGTVTSL